MQNKNIKIAIIGLGYVGLPLAVEFAKKYQVVGFDINEQRIDELNKGIDNTHEIIEGELTEVLNRENGIQFTVKKEDIKDFDFYIITVPTPVDNYNVPDFTPLIKASETVGAVMGKHKIIIYESTVYPGATEERCIPVLEQASGLTYNEDFFVGYSPERINPGDKERPLTKIKKIVSGSTPEVALKVQALYNSIITAGTHLAPSLKVAEAAKVVENIQRDINIAIVNELARIFNKLKIDTTEVLEAAGTKWNFINVRPGLVGGHCIGVDPYYMIQKANEAGYHPEIMLAARRLNESMSEFVAHELIRMMINKDIKIRKANILILGVTFKENCPDLRNTKVIDIINILREYDVHLDVYDPWVLESQLMKEYGLSTIPQLGNKRYDAVLLAVAHQVFKEIDLKEITKEHSIVYDLKSFYPKELTDRRL
ncbi:MAG TPA: nucleotide sugar dehydrogenase [Saprospiraceae bacterium]|nr:nucleotide sugar dehydrogenase [Saprospiraceae bacterium]